MTLEPCAARVSLKLEAPVPGVLLSVLIPAYNAAAYLPECLDELWQQRFEGLEVVVCDDGSQDGTASVIATERLRWGASLRQVLHPTNRGIGPTRNDLVQAARGNYLWFIDADDRIAPGALVRVRPFLEDTKPDVKLDALGFDFSLLSAGKFTVRRVRRNAHRVSFAGRTGKRITDASELLAGLLISGQLHPWSRIIHRNAWNGAPAFPATNVCEDVATMPLVMARCQSYLHLSEPLIAYRQHAASAMRTLSESGVVALSACTAALGVGLQALTLTTEARDAQADFATRMYRGACRQALKADLPLNNERLQRMVTYLELGAGRSVAEQLRSYIRRGRWADWLRFGLWLRWPALASVHERLRKGPRFLKHR